LLLLDLPTLAVAHRVAPDDQIDQDAEERQNEPARDAPEDIAVWRPSEAGEPAWPSPWGSGRPGWHAECAAMAISTFGPALDLHAGGGDLRFPHHTYESALAEAVTGVRPFARAWLQVGVVRIGEVKMAKSAGNLVFIADLLHRYPAAALRLLLLDHPWAAEWDYSPEALDLAAAHLERLHTAAGRTASSTAATESATRALLDDLDITTASSPTRGSASASGLQTFDVIRLQGPHC
jgi:cysteinyl-tRNA synthetase